MRNRTFTLKYGKGAATLNSAEHQVLHELGGLTRARAGGLRSACAITGWCALITRE